MTPVESTSRRRWRATAALLLAAALLAVVACTGGGQPSPSSPASEGPGGAPAGPVAPDFQLSLFETADYPAGQSLRLSDLEGRPVVLNFWFPSCPPCVAEMPDLEAAYQRYKDRVAFVGVQLVGLDSVQDGQEFVRRMGVNYALGPDLRGDIVKEYEVVGFPTTVFLDSRLRVVRKWTGVLNLEKLEEIIEGELLGGSS